MGGTDSVHWRREMAHVAVLLSDLSREPNATRGGCRGILEKVYEDHVEPGWDAVRRGQWGAVAGHVFGFREATELYRRCRAGEPVPIPHMMGARSWQESS